jgi:hypothetical protein
MWRDVQFPLNLVERPTITGKPIGIIFKKLLAMRRRTPTDKQQPRAHSFSDKSGHRQSPEKNIELCVMGEAKSLPQGRPFEFNR